MLKQIGINSTDIDIKRKTEKLMALSTPPEISKFLNANVKELLIIEHYFKHKSVNILSKTYGIPVLDLKFFFNSAEAYSTVIELKEKFKNINDDDVIAKELRSTLIEKFEELMEDAGPGAVLELVERMVPHILQVEKSIMERDLAFSNKKTDLFNIENLTEGEDFEIDLKTETPDTKEIENIDNENLLIEEYNEAQLNEIKNQAI